MYKENKTTIVTAVCGSHLFGTNHPGSDKDYVSIYRMGLQDLVMSKYERAYQEKTNTILGVKNTQDDIDIAHYELDHFIGQCLSGQTYALELLHTPANMITESSYVWDNLILHKDKLITNQLTGFMHYARDQAARYTKRGAKYNEITYLLNYLPNFRFLCDAHEAGIFAGLNHFEYRLRTNGTEYMLYGPTCKFPASRAVKDVLPTLTKRLEDFGERTKAAAVDGSDLKAYYHALRIVWELEEYLNHGKITFPNPRASELMKIRNSELTTAEIEDLIESELVRVDAIPNNLPGPDLAYWESWKQDMFMHIASTDMRKWLSKHDTGQCALWVNA